MTTPTLAGARAGLADITPPLIAAIPIGFIFGAIAATKGLSLAEVALMSATVFAGGAQFAAIEQWASPVPIVAIILSTALINARHVLMGASIAPKMARFTPSQRLAALFWMADENWALAERRAAREPLTPAYWFAAIVPFYLSWVVCSVLGAALGPLVGDPARIGADFAFTAVFIAIVAGFWKGRATAITIAAAAGISALTKITLGAPWHVPFGALAGIAAAAIAHRPEGAR